MTESARQMRLGIGAILLAAALLLYVIPNWVAAPANIRNAVMSPTFWPSTIAWLMGGVGLLCILQALRLRGAEAHAGDGAEIAAESPHVPGGYARLAAMAVIMVFVFYATPLIGMVWSCMVALAATAFLVRTDHPVVALVAAVAVPLILYAFFAHVAGVAVPQGQFVRLP